MSNTLRRLGLSGPSLLALAFLGGCGATEQTVSAEISGFLGDYSNVRAADPKGEQRYVAVDPAVKFDHYDSVALESVTFWVADESHASRLDAKTRQRLGDHLFSAAFNRLAKDYRMVAHAGPTTMKIRLAVTDAQGASFVLNTMTSSFPRLRELEPLAEFGDADAKVVAEAAVECEIVDSQSGRRLLAAIAEQWDSEPESAAKKWGDVDDAIDHWADLLGTRLAKLRAGDFTPIGDK